MTEAKAEAGSTTETKGDPKLAADSKTKSEPRPKAGPQPRPEVERAAADAHES